MYRVTAIILGFGFSARNGAKCDVFERRFTPKVRNHPVNRYTEDRKVQQIPDTETKGLETNPNHHFIEILKIASSQSLQ